MEEPKFKPGDIVYILFHPQLTLANGYPSIGTGAEIDCKVLNGPQNSPLSTKKTNNYTVVSGNGYYYAVPESLLVAAKDVYNYRTGTKAIAAVDTELFPKGTVFIKTGNYYICEPLGISIQEGRFNKIKKLFV